MTEFYLRDTMTEEERRDFDARMDLEKLMSLEKYLFKDKHGHILENCHDYHKVIQKPLIYYAHCIALFDTPQELRDIELLKQLGFAVFNPNSKECKEGYENQTFTIGQVKYGRADPMIYYKKLIEDRGFNALAFRALPDGRIPAGVGYEMDVAYDANMPVFELPNAPGDGDFRRMTASQTKAYLCEVGQR